MKSQPNTSLTDIIEKIHTPKASAAHSLIHLGLACSKSSFRWETGLGATTLRWTWRCTASVTPTSRSFVCKRRMSWLLLYVAFSLWLVDILTILADCLQISRVSIGEPALGKKSILGNPGWMECVLYMGQISFAWSN